MENASGMANETKPFAHVTAERKEFTSAPKLFLKQLFEARRLKVISTSHWPVRCFQQWRPHMAWFSRELRSLIQCCQLIYIYIYTKFQIFLIFLKCLVY